MNVYEALQYMIENPFKRIESNSGISYYFSDVTLKVMQIWDNKESETDTTYVMFHQREYNFRITREYQTLIDLSCRWLEKATIKRVYDGVEYEVLIGDARGMYRMKRQMYYEDVKITPKMAREKVWWVDV